MGKVEYRGRIGRVVGAATAAILALLSVTSFDLLILCAGLLLAVLALYLGDRFDRTRLPDPN